MFCVVFAHSGYARIFGLRYGLVAVESFFVISGFLIGEMLLRDFRNGFNLADLKDFWIKRWFRTLPLYYVTLILKFIFIDSTVGWSIIYYFLFLQNNFYGIGFLQVSWTLVLEEWFYLLMPVLFFVFFRKGINPKGFFIFIAGYVLLSNLARFAWVMYTDRPFGAIIGNFPFRFDSFLIGVALAALKIFYKQWFNWLARPFVFIVSGLLLLVLLYFFRRDDGGNTEDTVVWIRTVWFSLISLALTLTLPFFTNARIFNSDRDPLRFKWLITWISLLSYPIYLVHVDIYHQVSKLLPSVNTLHPALIFVIKNFFAVILSLLLYHFVHSPLLRLRTKLLSKKKSQGDSLALSQAEIQTLKK